MALQESIPVTQNLALTVGSALSIKYIPKNPDGTIFDLTGYSIVSTMKILDALTSGVVLDTLAPTVILADATGVTIQFLQTVPDSCWGVLGINRGAYNLLLGDGTDTVNVGYGNLSVQQTGF